VELLIRTWNVFHGNAHPPRSRSYLRQMIELASADRPDVLCLQELPLWSLRLLGAWSGMQVEAVPTFPSVLPRRLAGWVTRRHQGLLRSAIAGQANAILVSPDHALERLERLRVSAHGHHPRFVHAVRIDGRLTVVNAHLSPNAEELERAFVFAEQWRPSVLAGDLNRRGASRPAWSAGAAGIDHVIGYGVTVRALTEWDTERRTVDGVVLSDHAPVEARCSFALDARGEAGQSRRRK